MDHARQQLIEDISRCIAALWTTVLHRDDIDPNANFFDLGGSSLKMIRFHASLQNALNIKLPIVDLFAHPTMSGLAQHLASRSAAPGTEGAVLQPDLPAPVPVAAPAAGAKQFRSFRKPAS